MASLPYCEKLGINRDVLQKYLEAVTNPTEMEDLPQLCLQGVEVKKGVIYEVHKFASGHSADKPALLLLKLLNRDFDTSSLFALRTKMKRLFSKQSSISGKNRTSFLEETFSFPVQETCPTVQLPDAQVADGVIDVDSGSVHADVDTDIGHTDLESVPGETAIDCVVGVGRENIGGRTVRDETGKMVGSLTHEIAKKERHVKMLENKIESLKKDLVYYDPVNVRNRERNKNETIQKLRDNLKDEVRAREKIISTYEATLVEKQTLIDSLNKRISELELELNERDEKILKEQRLKSYYRTKPEKDRASRKELNKLKRYISELENRLVPADPNNAEVGVHEISGLRNDDDSVTDKARLCIMDLLGLEVAISKVPEVIKAVGSYIFHVNFSQKELPSRQTVLRISDEGQYLVKLYTAEKLQSSAHFGVNKDGTSRKKVKILETSVTLDSGQQLPLGFHRTAREDADTITHSVKTGLEELSVILSHSTSDSTVDELRVSALAKLSFFMTDRAANEKKSNRQLTEWVNDEMMKAELPLKPVFSIHCMAHVLLAFHKYGLDSLMELQNELVMDGPKLGRDANGAFFRFGKENAAPRVVRMTSQLLGPNVDEKNGIRDKWLADLRSKNLKSLMGDYKDNRFNGIFEGSAQILHHINDILALENRLKEPINQKVVSVFLDLKDSRVVTMVQAIALFYVKLTEPYWRLVLSKEVEYGQLPNIIQALAAKLALLPDNPGLLLDDDEPLVPGFQAKADGPFYASSTTIRHQDRTDLLHRCISKIAFGMTKAVDNQLSAFLPGGEIASKSPDDLKRLGGSGLTNLVSERNFGSLDASQKRRRHATLHYHSTILLLKTSRTRMIDWLMSKPAKERKELLQKARTHGQWLREKHRREEVFEKRREQDVLDENEAERTRKAARKLVKAAKAKAVKNVKVVQKKVGAERRTKARKQKEVVVELPDTGTLTVGQWIGVAYENCWFPGMFYFLINLTATASNII